MTRQIFEPHAWSETFRDSFTPVHTAQQEGLKALERLIKFQHAVTDQYLQNSLAQVQVALSSRDPSEILSKQAELRTEFVQWLSSRAQELVALASETQRADSGGENTSSSESAEPQERGGSDTPHGRRARERRSRPR